jgi:phosphotransferase system  glucose/maltose/N-acetylglucosamine-specific IIC component
MSVDQQFPPPPGQPDYPPAPPQPRGMSGLAVTGFILAFLIAPIGFILSLIAAFTTGPSKAKNGRGLAIAGIIISLLLMIGTGIAVYAVSQSTVADPGCTAGKEAILNGPAQPSQDQLQKMADDLNAAAAKAKHDNVRDAMKALAADYTSLLDGLKSGNVPAGIVDKVGADAQKIDDLCTISTK